jgi:hypothetical protein
MAYWIDNIERPIKEQFEEYDRTIRKYTIFIGDDNFEFADFFDIL